VGARGLGVGARGLGVGLAQALAVGVPIVFFVWEYECSSSVRWIGLDAPSSLEGVAGVRWVLP